MRFWNNSDSESDSYKKVSVTKDCIEEDPEESSSGENESPDTPVVSQPPTDTIPFKNGKIIWSPSQLQQQGRLSAANIIKMIQGPTMYVSHDQFRALPNTTD